MMSHPKGGEGVSTNQSQGGGGDGGRSCLCTPSKHSISSDGFDIKKMALKWVHFY